MWGWGGGGGGGGGHFLVINGFLGMSVLLYGIAFSQQGSPFQAFSIELLEWSQGDVTFFDFELESKKIICPKVIICPQGAVYNCPENRPVIDFNGVGILRCQQDIPSKN